MTDVLLDRWWSAMFAASWQFTLLFAVVAIVIWIMGARLTPAVRHNMWLVVMLRLALPVGLEAPFGLAPRPGGFFEPAIVGSPPASRIAKDLVAVVDPTAGSNGRVPLAPEHVEAANAARRPSANATRIQRTLFSIWCAGLLVLSAVHVLRTRRSPRRPIVPHHRLPEPLQSAMDRASTALRLRRPPSVVITDDGALDIRVAGVFAPRLLVPARMVGEWSGPELEPILVHELAHVRRADPLTRALANLLETAFFFHPLVWIAARRMAVERELACDDAAVRCTGHPRYVESLLRFAAERLYAPRDRFSLGAGGGAAALRSRLERMLDAGYQPAARTSRAVLAGVVAALAIGAGASVYGERVEPVSSRSTSEERRLGIVFTTLQVFAVRSVGEVHEGGGVPLSGDYEWRGSVKGSAAEVKRRIDTPELRRLLVAPESELVYRLVVDPQGQVRDVKVSKTSGTAVNRAVQAALRGLKIEPAIRRADGKAVYLTMDARVFLEPSPSSRLDALRALVDGELEGEVVDLAATRAAADGQSPVSLYERPPYVRIASRPPAPSGIVAVSDGIYSLALDFEPDGRVRSIEPVTYQSPTESYPRSDVEASPPETVRRWVESFVLELEPGLAAEASTLRGVVDVELRAGEATVLTRAPASIDALRASIAESYGLAADASLDLVPGPRSAGRTLLYRFGDPVQARAVPDGPTRMVIYVGDDGRPRFGGASFGGGTLGDLLRTIDWDEPSVRGDAALLEHEVAADIVLRQSFEPVNAVSDLERALRQRVGFAVDLDVRDEARDTIVLRGSFGAITPDADPDAGGLPTVHVYADRRDGGGGGFATGSAAVFLPRFLAIAVGMPVVDETIGPSPTVHVSLHRSARDTEHVDAVLRNLERETGLTISIEKRPVQILVVSEAV